MAPPTFPALIGLSYPVKRSPLWSTLRQVSTSGKDTPLQQWTYPRYRIELTYDLLRSDANAELQTLAGFFNSLGGSAGVFKFADPDDGSVTDMGFGQGNGVATAFQLTRSFGGFVEPIFSPTGTPVIKVAGAATGAFTMSTTGLITFNAAPANGAALTWTGAFTWLCRFDADTVEFDKIMQAIWQLGKIAFTTIKL